MDSNAPATPVADRPCPDDFRTLADVLASLPGVQPRIARRELEERLLQAVMGDDDTVAVGSVCVQVVEFNEMFQRDSRARTVVSPRGAGTLMRLYAAGCLPTAGKPAGVPPSDLLAYERSHDELVEKAAARRVEKASTTARLDDLPNVVEPLTFDLLEKLFYRHNGPGAGTLTIGGRRVDKKVTRYSSNTGLSHDWSVRYQVVGADGKVVEHFRPSLYEGNRRNDPERDWGLPA